MEWNKGFTASYYGMTVDPSTWADQTRFEIIGGTIERELNSLRTSADIDVTEYDVGAGEQVQRIAPERYIRIYLDAFQNGDGAHVPVFTGLATTPARNWKGYREENRLECFSVLKPCDDILLQRGWYVPAGLKLDNIFKNLLSYTPAPVEIADGMKGLESAIIAEDSETALSMIDKMLEALNWRIRLLGDGTIRIEPKPTEASIQYDANENDGIEPEVTVDSDWYELPNVFRAISEDLVAIARDEDPTSPLSIQARGREVWAQETNADLDENESIAAYAARRLKEEQNKARTITYTRAFNPELMVGDLVRLHYPAQQIDGVFSITKQSIQLGHGASTQEEVKDETD